ncbi:MAG: hypothetical protein ABSC62_08455 [Terracidiphilus sp.]|jgi:hypothetical protein
MLPLNRRGFLSGVLAAGTTLAASSLPVTEAQEPAASPAHGRPKGEAGDGASIIDFRYAPVLQQTAFCFPDDSYKSLVDQVGHLLYGYERGASSFSFSLKVGFALDGMQAPRVLSQQIENPGVPIVRTSLEYPGALMTLTAFATNDGAEGRVDNVIVDVTPNSGDAVNIEPLINFDTTHKFDLEEKDGILIVLHRDSREVLLTGKVMGNPPQGGAQGGSFDWDTESDRSQRLRLRHGQASKTKPYRAFFRFPLARQERAAVVAGLSDLEGALESCRSFWKSWSAFRSPVAWSVPGRRGEFVEACARNILQAREVRDGKLTFQVGPTCYRGLWVVDGNFILEAARYLGYDKDAEQGLRTTWSRQQSNGQIVAGGGTEHWKDTAIAMFTLVRQCQLSQDWSLLRELESQVVQAIGFLRSLQALATKQDSGLGRYGLLARGFADGGIAGPCDELTNTVWVLAGLKAIAEASESEKIGSLKDARGFFNELEAAFQKAAAREMLRYEGGFAFLPMLLKDDPQWQSPDPWDRPRPQSAQWALSHAIFPGRVFEPQHPIVRGHVQLMQAVTKEDIPAETGWARHEAVWNYNAAFVAEVYLWLGMKQAAHDTFIGFLNHASPQYCWREEQPLQNALVSSYVGDMPHNWASAECIRYVRHMLALENGRHLRLLAGVTGGELAPEREYVLTGTPTRFGRLDLKLEPLDGGHGWRVSFERGPGPAPQKISLPGRLGSRFQFSRIEGAQSRAEGELVLVDSAASRWTAFWKG